MASGSKTSHKEISRKGCQREKRIVTLSSGITSSKIFAPNIQDNKNRAGGAATYRQLWVPKEEVPEAS